MIQIQNSKYYDLERRTFSFAQSVNLFIKKLPKTISNTEYAKQLIRSSGSVGANYIEANESLGKKDFAMRIRICRKEAKESRYWLELLNIPNVLFSERAALVKEATELIKIFSSIVGKCVHWILEFRIYLWFDAWYLWFNMRYTD